MAARFVTVDRDTQLLMPPDMREWGPENHLSHFILDAVEGFDTNGAKVNHRGSGSDQYPPAMMLALLIYSYSSGVFSSRSIEMSTYDSVATRVLCADTHPDHDTICAFRRENGPLLEKTFSHVLELAARVGVMKVGKVTVAIDGTKILANASKHSAMSYDKAGEAMQELDLEIAELLKKAETADSTPLEDGLTVPMEIARREARKAKLQAARAVMEARGAVRAAAERVEYEAKKAKREAQREQGKKPRGKEPKEPEDKPGAKDQMKFTDPESRIMPCGGKTHFEQAYNAQAEVEIESRLIDSPEARPSGCLRQSVSLRSAATKRVSQAPNDKQELVENVRAIDPVIQNLETILIDSGFVSEAAVAKVKAPREDGKPVPKVLGAVQRKSHHRSVKDLEKKEDPPAPGEGATFTEKMAHRTATKEGREKYKQRQQTIEPVFGIIKEAMGFRRFRLRGRGKVALEWTLVCVSYNLRRLHRLVTTPTQKIIPA